MAVKHLMIIVLLVFFMLAKHGIAAEKDKQNQFQSGSYQQILANNKEQPFILSVWSVTCSSCLKEMELVRKIHNKKPELKFVMLSVDDFSDVDEVRNILYKQGVADLESWVFAEQNSQRLRFEIDSGWYGEIPRTYFFDKSHNRVGVSGLITEKEYLLHIAKTQVR